MSSIVQSPPLQYVDRAVQTDPELCKAQVPLASSETDRRSSTLSPVAETEELHESEMSYGAFSRTSTPFGSAYSEPFDRSGTPSPEPTITTKARVYKGFTSLGRMNGTTISTAPRIVSLPETVSRYSAKVVVQKSTPRAVSTPMPTTGSKNLLPGSPAESDDELLLFGTNGEGTSYTHAHSQVPETPHTPSPVSSPESIVIIGNNNQLADSFLRGDQIQISDQKEANKDDQGWISWASSPPRPIPALHGPLSLPYARCPSGAEGTIIEEPDNLPRMIWGLEGEGSHLSRSKDSSSQQPGPTKSPARSTHRVNKASVPPRLQLGASATPSDLGSQLMGLTIHETPETGSVSTARRGAPQGQDFVSYPLCGQEPIDLAELVRNEMELTRPDILADNAHGHSGDHRSGMLLNHHGNNWSNTPIVPRIMKDNNPLAVSNLTNQRPLQADRFSNAPGGPFGSYDVFSQAIPSLRAHARDTSHASERLTPRRQTALEIAQQYRHQQAQQQRQQQSALPTPPNSSSPIWSSSFSPYPSSVVSPELRSNVSGLNKLSPPIVHPRSGNVLLDISQQLGRGSIAALSDRQSEIDLLTLASTAHLDDHYGLHATSPPLYTVSDSVQGYMRGQYRLPSEETVRQNVLGRSPAVPRPPPNTPYTALSRGHVVQHKLAPPSAMVTPPSPTSPQQPRTYSLSSQQNRSVPITRLIQRRLSAVPEEDSPSLPDDGVPTMGHPYSCSEMQSHNLDLPADIQWSHLQHLLSPPLTGQHIRMRGVDMRFTGLSSSSTDGRLADLDQHAVHVKLPATSTRRPVGPRNPRSDDRAPQALGRRENINDDSPNAGSARGRAQRRGGVRGRGRGGRTPTVSAVNRPERVDGGLMVKS